MSERLHGAYQMDEAFYKTYPQAPTIPLQAMQPSNVPRSFHPAGDDSRAHYLTSPEHRNDATIDMNNNSTLIPSFGYVPDSGHELVAGWHPPPSATWSAGHSNAGRYSSCCYMPYNRACYNPMTTVNTSNSHMPAAVTEHATSFNCPHRYNTVWTPQIVPTKNSVALRSYSATSLGSTSEGYHIPSSAPLTGAANDMKMMPLPYEATPTFYAGPPGFAQEGLVRCISSTNSSGGCQKRVLNTSAPSTATIDTVVSTFTPPYGSTQNPNALAGAGLDSSNPITLQITNLNYSMDEVNLRNFLLNQLRPIAPVVSLTFEGGSYAKVTVPDLFYAKQVVSHLHRKKIGHKRLLVSYTRDSSLTEINTLRCQVAGLLRDVPYSSLPMYKFRELFQSRFKTSISVVDLCKMPDICTIITDKNEEKFITLQPELANCLENSPLIEGLQHSIPYCTIHFKHEQHKGWAEQEIEPLPNVFMSIAEIQKIVYPLLRNHTGDVPVASLLHCISGQMNVQIVPDDNGVNLEHLVCCIQGIQIQINNFGIKILTWTDNSEKDSPAGAGTGGGSSSSSVSSNRSISSSERAWWTKNAVSDPLQQISREIVELIKMSPKATMKFNRFIPAYHNHFGKQCRVADYGYTKLIELFEALSSVVQIMGDGENRQITLTHRTQLRRFTSDLLRILRTHCYKSMLLSQLPTIFGQTQNRPFDVTDYGVCNLHDILDGLANSNVVVVSKAQDGKDILISVPKRKQTNAEIENTIIFAGEMIELFRNAPQYTILFQKFVRSYHYHFAYQCRLSDYGFVRLADLMEAIQGVVEMEQSNDEDKKLFLSPNVARRVFAEQCEELILNMTGSAKTCMKLDDVLQLHKKKFGYQMQPQSLGAKDMLEAVELMPYIEVLEIENLTWIVCHHEDSAFRVQCYRACKHLLTHQADQIATNNDAPTTIHLKLTEFITEFNETYKENITENTIKAMKHFVQIFTENEIRYVRNSNLAVFLTNIVRLVELRSSAPLSDIKNALNCSIKRVSEFGYPNLFTLLTAYNDIFAIKLGVSQERSEIYLQPNSPFRLGPLVHRHHLYGSLKLPSGRVKHPRTTRQSSADEPHPSRNINAQDTGNHSGNSTFKIKFPSQLNQKPPMKPLYGAKHQLHKSATEFNNYTPLSSAKYSEENANNYPAAVLLQTSLNSSTSTSTAGNSHIENSFNSSLNAFNVSFDSSNASLSDTSASVCADMKTEIEGIPGLMQVNQTTANLWNRRQFTMQRKQHDPDLFVQELRPPVVNVTTSAQQQFLLPQNMATQHAHSQQAAFNGSKSQTFALYNPPKPDTPTTNNAPYWNDPIWSHNVSGEHDFVLNLKLLEMKSPTTMTTIYSPYTISKAENLKRQVFNFINHDRKIA